MENTAEGKDEDRVVDDHGRDFIERAHHFPANAPGFLLAPVIWFVYFVGVYSLQGAGCAIGLDERSLFGFGTLRLVLAVATLLAIAAIVLAGVWSFRSWHALLRDLEEEERQAHGYSTFLAYGALLHSGLFLVATVWTGIPILMVDSCDLLGTS